MEQNQDEFDQKRFLIAMILSGLILVLWNVFFAPEKPPASQPETGAATTQAPPTEKAPSDAKAPVKLAEPAPPAIDLPILKHELKNDHIRVATSTRDARMVEAEVFEPEQYNVEGDLLKAFPEDSSHFPYGISFTQNSIALPRDLVWAFAPDASEKAGDSYSAVTYRHVDPAGRYQIDKTFRIDPDDIYQLELELVVTNRAEQGSLSDTLALDITGYKDPTKETSFLDMLPNEVEAICKTTDDLEREKFSAVDTPLTYDEFPVRWGGVDDRYFLFAALTATDAERCTIEIVAENHLVTRLTQPPFSIGPGESYRMTYQLFVGPKDFDVLETMGANMEGAIDYGFWTFLARPLRWVLVEFHGWVGNWGLAIILLTIVLRLLMWPINHKVYVNSERMKDLQPKLTALREQYKDDQTRIAEETMKLWKENKVSPLGCLPMVLQFPILLALYFMILNSVELYQADFALWYTDLSAPDPYFVLPILMGVVMFGQQSMMTVETPNPQMATMMKFMPVMFTAFMLFLPSGVVLYYFVSLIIGLIQQILIKRSFAAKRAATA